MTKEIPLSQGKVALVDDADYEWLNQWKWSYSKPGPKHRVGYVVRKEESDNRRAIYMHRLILGLSDNEATDHVNGNGLDNRRTNLRIASPSENSCNVPKQRQWKGSRFKGVWPYAKRWRAQIGLRYIGMFLTEEEAALAYNIAALTEYGEFASLNPISEEQAVKAHKARIREIERLNHQRIQFGQELRGRRLRAHLTQQELADLVEIDHSLVSLYETGRRLPTVKTICKLATAIKQALGFSEASDEALRTLIGNDA